MKTTKPQLTISLLASNRPDTIRRCLDSLQPIRDAIACELILIDTSKNAEIHSILSEYTNQVYEFEWCNDFAKARNEGLSRAKGEWFMYLDDDEWFEETDTLVHFFQSGEYKQYGYANHKVRNFLDETYTNYSEAWITRLACIERDIRFEGKVHECFSELNGKKIDLDLTVFHSGYIYATPEKERKHFERNKGLLLEMIEKEPNRIRWWIHLTQEYYAMREWDDLEAFCKKSLHATVKCERKEEVNYIAVFYVGWVNALLGQKKYEECVSVCKQALTDKRSREVLKAMMHLKLSESYFRLGQREDALEQVAIYLHALRTTNQKDADIFEQLSIILVGEVFESYCQKAAYSILICCELEKGNTEALKEHYERLGWNNAAIVWFEDIEKYLVKAMWSLAYEPIFTHCIVDAFRNGRLQRRFCEAIIGERREAGNAFQAVLYAFSEAMLGIVEGPQKGDLLAYYNALQYYVQATCQWYDFLQEQDAIGLLGEENPDYIEAAINISDYLELESQGKIEALTKLKEAVENVPEFADGIGAFLHSYTDLEKQRAELQKKEMDALRIQVIGQVKMMLENGQIEAAKQIVVQLKQMFPGDLEVEQLAKEV